MTARTHLVGGALASVAVVGISLEGSTGYFPEHTFPVLFTCTTLALIGSLFPDLDLQTSRMGKKLKPVSSFINFLFGHRTLLHSPLFYALVCIVLIGQFPATTQYALSFTLGAASHLLLDCFNRAGIPLLYPYSRRFHIGCIATGIQSRSENIFCIVLSGITIAFAIVVFSRFILA